MVLADQEGTEMGGKENENLTKTLTCKGLGFHLIKVSPVIPGHP
jgi:hypothetical protein